MGDYRSLRVWKVAHELTLEVYRVTQTFPAAERYGLKSQLRRSAASVPANIAEGCGRDSDAELARFARIALGSSNELDYHLLLSRDLGFPDEEAYACLTETIRQIRSMLAKLVDSLQTDSRQPTADSRRPIADS